MHQLHDQSIVFPDDKKDPANPNRWTEIKFNGSEFKAGNCFMTQMFAVSPIGLCICCDKMHPRLALEPILFSSFQFSN